MKIAIDASPAFRAERTGIEEYTYQIIKHLRSPLSGEDVTLFVKRGGRAQVDFKLPPGWRVREIWMPRLWTYVGLSLVLLVGRYDRLFVPGHVVPPIHPKQTVVVIHGLEYERVPDAFSARERRSMRFSIKRSCRWARRILCVSNNTKKDLKDLYQISQNKMRVVYEGVNPAPRIDHHKTQDALAKWHITKGGYLLFIGRIETRKNIITILQAYEMLREHFHIAHKLVLAGKSGVGYDEILRHVEEHPFREDIIMTGFVSDDEKWSLLAGAHVFLFPTLYEGFGLPVLEAQQMGVPVVTSKTSSLGEVAKNSAVTIDPMVPQELAEGVQSLLGDADVYAAYVTKGRENLERFDWNRAAKLTAKMIVMSS